ncbi:MAG: transposase [Chloroflexota bacterium]|nr:transposase [Chloroflexota bacterium]MDE2918777.1 transposase [Chloroflexota bacterium]
MTIQRRTGVDAAPGYRNGHGRPRRLARMSETVRRRRPRGQGLEARFGHRRLPLFKRRAREVAELLPQLDVQGLAEAAVELARRGLRGAGAPLAASSIARLKAGWQLPDAAFKRRPRHDLEVGDLWVDGGYVKAGLERDPAALLVAIGARRDGRQVVLTVEPGERESTDTWASGAGWSRCIPRRRKSAAGTPASSTSSPSGPSGARRKPSGC